MTDYVGVQNFRKNELKNKLQKFSIQFGIFLIHILFEIYICYVTPLDDIGSREFSNLYDHTFKFVFF